LATWISEVLVHLVEDVELIRWAIILIVAAGPVGGHRAGCRSRWQSITGRAKVSCGDRAVTTLSPERVGELDAVFAVLGLIVAYQVKRVRALSLYYEHRPLP